MFPRSRKAKRHSSKLSFGSVLDGMGELVQTRTTSSKGSSTQPSGAYDGRSSENTSPCESLRKELISAPFNFQHLTHTRPQHLPSLEQASQQELADEFRTIRASQAPRRELFGIQVKDIRSPLPSAPPAPLNLVPRSLDAPDSFELPMHSAPLSSTRAGSALEKSASHEPRTIKKARSVESFSQPFVKPRSPKSSTASPNTQSPINPPPRTSSRQAQTRPLESPRSIVESPIAPTFNRDEFNGASAVTSAETSPQRNGVDDATQDWPINPSAVSTLEECSRQNSAAATPGYSTDLEDVPEEMESYFQYRASGRPRASSRSSSLRRSHSFPVIVSPFKPSPRQSKATPSPSKDPSESQGIPDSPPRSRCSSPSISTFRSNDPFGVVTDTLEGSWEDVIDYCYEHAAEADCDFDWDRASTVEAVDVDDGLWMPKRMLSIRRRPSERKPVGSTATPSFYKIPPSRATSNPDRPQIVVPDVSMVPDLATKSATSLGTSSTVPTPSDSRDAPEPFRLPSPHVEQNGLEAERLIPTPTPFPPKPHLYEEGLIDDLVYDRDSSIYRPRLSDIADNRYSGPESVRSHLSKCSSEESFARPFTVTNTTAATYPAGNSKRISSSSAGSLPDLVCSRRSTRHYQGPARAVIEEQPHSPDTSPVEDRGAALPLPPSQPLQQQQPNADAAQLTRPPVPPRGRSSTAATGSPRRLSQSVATPRRVSASQVDAQRQQQEQQQQQRKGRRASSTTRGATLTSAPGSATVSMSEPVRQQIDEGTRDLLQIGRPRKADRTLSLFPSVAQSLRSNAAVS
ncbi:MAG: hypothetical protein M1821_008829 [Bathelium mastoideum]|nr:MAG: hypothetical protein M1821_008829 [Bathelium mastoideum]